MKTKVYCGPQNESGGTQWKLQLRFTAFSLARNSRAKC